MNVEAQIQLQTDLIMNVDAMPTIELSHMPTHAGCA
jgi:hypothetical protein